MKVPILLMFGALALATGRAQLPDADNASEITPLRIRYEDAPVFPRDLQVRGIRRGTVVVAFGVGVDGRVDDCLALAYTDEDFASITLANLRHWTFYPLRVGGEPVPSTGQLTFNFETDGTVLVSLTPEDTPLLLSPEIWHENFHVRDLRDLDAIPHPLTATPPLYPLALARSLGATTVRVNFFIDPTGAVRLPSVVPTQDLRLSALAIRALQTWKFEPPLCNHHPVLVRASQLFRFEPPKQ